MPLNIPQLSAEIYAILFPAKNIFDNIPDSHKLTGFGRDYLATLLTDAIAIAVINHFKNNAVVVGIDSHGDSHALTIT